MTDGGKMLISCTDALAEFRKHEDSMYHLSLDLKRHFLRSGLVRYYFARCRETLGDGTFISFTMRRQSAELFLYRFDSGVFKEALDYARAGVNNVFFITEEKYAKEALKYCSATRIAGDGYLHYGVYGRTDDFPKPMRIYDVAHAEIFTKDIIEELPVYEWRCFPLLARLKETYPFTLIAWDGKQPLGYLIFNPKDENFNEILYLFVHPSYRGKGVAKELISVFCKETFSAKKTPFFGKASTPGMAAMASALGFKQLEPPKQIYKLTE